MTSIANSENIHTGLSAPVSVTQVYNEPVYNEDDDDEDDEEYEALWAQMDEDNSIYDIRRIQLTGERRAKREEKKRDEEEIKIDEGIDVYGGIELANEMIASGANLDVQDQEGSTVLMNSVVYGKLELFKDMITSGANTDVQDNEGETALIIASYSCEMTSFLTYLIDANANLDIQDDNGTTALMHSTFSELSILQALVDGGAQLDIRDNDEQTALIIATSYHMYDAIRVLISAGAKYDIKDYNGNTALMIARNEVKASNDNWDCHMLVEILESEIEKRLENIKEDKKRMSVVKETTMLCEDAMSIIAKLLNIN